MIDEPITIEEHIERIRIAFKIVDRNTVAFNNAKSSLEAIEKHIKFTNMVIKREQDIWQSQSYMLRRYAEHVPEKIRSIIAREVKAMEDNNEQS
jgi:hypothetical protein